jgi:CubicO group peptidase (beta-lactamase class C family)
MSRQEPERVSYLLAHAHTRLLMLMGTLMLAAWTAASSAQNVSIAAGFKAGFTSSAVFLGGRNPLDVMREELQGVPFVPDGLPAPVVDYEHQVVFVDYPGSAVPRMAVYRDGVGTTLTPPGWTLKDISKLPRVTVPMPTGDPAHIPWPDGDLIEAHAWPAVVDHTRLQTVLDAAFSPGPQAHFKTIGVVVVYQNRLLAERYAPGWGVHVPYRTWSTGKSIMSALIGILVRQGRLKVDDRAPIAAWQGKDDPRSAITIRHLLHMSSGLNNGGTRTGMAYWGGINTAEAIVSTSLQAQPGSRWEYANYDTLLLVLSMKEVLGGAPEYWHFPYHELLHKIGMRNTTLELDAYGNFIMSSQNYSTPRDLARFGLLYLHDGVWNGERILPEGWVDFTTQPASADTQQRYGAQFWLFGGDPRLPDDVFSTAGSRGQFATICPSNDLVVVRMGLDSTEGRSWDQPGFVAAILAAIGETR